MTHVLLSEDDMQATLVLEPGEAIAPEAARALLAQQGVVAGLCEETLASLDAVSGPAEVVVAIGQVPAHGADARVEYLFRAGPQDLTPVIRPDGTADFRNLGAVAHVAPGQLLARRTPPQPGRAGRTVRDRALPPTPGRDQRLAAGEGAALSADGLTVTAVREGNPHLKGRVVVVVPQYTVPGNVSLATGNIRFEGDMVILGHVEAQMEVHASGSISIRGHVEGARVVAGGSIVVEGGVRHQATLEAADGITVRFVEGSTVRCGGSLGAKEDIVHCHVDAGAAVVAGGAIVGGSLNVAQRVEARMLGARLGTPTQIAVVPPVVPNEALKAIEAEREAIQRQLAIISPKIREAQEAIADPHQQVDVRVFRKVLELAAQLAERDHALAERAAELAAEAAPRARSEVVARDGCHPGVHVQVGAGHMAVKDPMPPVTLVEDRGHVRILAFVPHAAMPLALERT
jgi:uncharacterized protein (DUF342 family)